MAIKELDVADFSGGRVNFPDQVLIESNNCVSASKNVWAAEGGLTKSPGYVLQASFSASGTSTMAGFWSDDIISTANKLFYRINLSSTGGNGNNYFPFASGVIFTDSLTPLGYTTGTVSISGANLISATGNGTLWLQNIRSQDRFQSAQNKNGWYLVSSVEDDTHLTLAAAVPTAIAPGSNYTIQLGLSFIEEAQASLNGSMMWTTTGDIMQRYDGTGVTRLASAAGSPNAAFMTVFQNYLFAARTAAFLSRVFWSTIQDPLTWPVNNFIDVDVLTGQITGLFSFGGELIVFKTRNMYKIIGNVFDPSNPTYYVVKIAVPPDFQFNSNYSCSVWQTQPSVGYTSNGLSYTNGKLVFYGGGRIFMYMTGTTFVTDVSQNIIRDLPTTFANLTDVNPSIDQRIQAISYNGYYIIKGLTDPNFTGTSNQMSLILDRNMKWWYLNNTNNTTLSDPFDVGKMAIVPSTTTRPQLAISMFNSPSRIFTWDFIGPIYGTNYINIPASGASNAVAIEGIWQSKEFNIEYGTFKWIIVYLKKQSAGNLTVKWSIDQQTQVTYNIDMSIGRGNIIRAVVPIGQKGSTIQLTLSNNTISQTFKVYAIKIHYEDSRMERLL